LGLSVKGSLEERCYGILEEKGGKIADEAREILLKEKSLTGLRQPLRHISDNWRDPFAPSMVILSCEAVGGKPDDATHQTALAMTLMNLSVNLWDDIVDRTMYKGFIQTALGKFGEGITLMIGGLASAKAFSVLGEMTVDEAKRQLITRLVWNYWRKLAQAETANLELRTRGGVRPEQKLKVIEMHAVNLRTLSKIGALLGNGSEDEMEHLGNYGKCLYTILELRKDFNVSVNLTLELAEKIRSRALPYALLWARNRCATIRKNLPILEKTTIQPIDIKRIVEAVFETRGLENTLGLIKASAQKAEQELSHLRDSTATRALIFLSNAQPEIFEQSLSNLLF
jgi:geranylgeranyl pyrophosphate synthase